MNSINKRRGVLLMSLGVGFLTCGEAVLKFLTAAYSPFQILFMRSLIALPFLLLLWRKNNSFSDLFYINVKDQLIRNGFLILAIILAILSLSIIPLFQYASLFFSAPFFIVTFSIFLLGEVVTKGIWFSLIIGFLGVILVFNPANDFLLEIGCFAALLSAAFYGLGMVLTSKLSQVNSPLLMTLWYTGMCFIVGLGGSLLSPFTLQLNDLPLFALAALLNIGANFAISKSFQYAQASYLAPLEYSAIPLSGLLGYLIWAQIPERSALFGTLLIIGSGFYIFKKEKKLIDDKREELILRGELP